MIIQPEHFEQIGVGENGDALYRLPLECMAEDLLTSVDIARDAGGNLSPSGSYFAHFSTNNLPLLCKRIERLANGE